MLNGSLNSKFGTSWTPKSATDQGFFQMTQRDLKLNGIRRGESLPVCMADTISQPQSTVQEDQDWHPAEHQWIQKTRCVFSLPLNGWSTILGCHLQALIVPFWLWQRDGWTVDGSSHFVVRFIHSVSETGLQTSSHFYQTELVTCV